MLIRATMESVIIALFLSSTLYAQAVALPSEMHSNYLVGRTCAERFWLPTDPMDWIEGTAYFDNENSRDVVLQWNFQKGVAFANRATETITLSFFPTAICSRAGTATTLYVVGWSPRTRQVIVEEWDIAGYGLGTAIPQGGGPSTSLLTAPTITRSVVFASASDTLKPIWDAVCYSPDNALWVLDSGCLSPTVPVTTIWKIDLATSSLSALYSSNSYPELLTFHSMDVGLDASDQLVLFAESRRGWESPMAYFAPPFNVFFAVDQDHDGTIDSAGVTPVSALTASGAWNSKFSEAD